MTKKKIPVITIDTGVPIPDTGSYPFSRLEVGHSFVAPIDMRTNISSAATQYGKRTGTKFTIRKIDKDNIRVWRSE